MVVVVAAVLLLVSKLGTIGFVDDDANCGSESAVCAEVVEANTALGTAALVPVIIAASCEGGAGRPCASPFMRKVVSKPSEKMHKTNNACNDKRELLCGLC